MLLTATLLGLIAALGILDGRLLGVSMIDRDRVFYYVRARARSGADHRDSYLYAGADPRRPGARG